jgi:hypothetical protein
VSLRCRAPLQARNFFRIRVSREVTVEIEQQKKKFYSHHNSTTDFNMSDKK